MLGICNEFSSQWEEPLSCFLTGVLQPGSSHPVSPSDPRTNSQPFPGMLCSNGSFGVAPGRCSMKIATANYTLANSLHVSHAEWVTCGPPYGAALWLCSGVKAVLSALGSLGKQAAGMRTHSCSCSWFLAELRPNLWSVYVDIHKAAAVFKEEEEMLVLVAAVVKPNPWGFFFTEELKKKEKDSTSKGSSSLWSGAMLSSLLLERCSSAPQCRDWTRLRVNCSKNKP